MQNNIKTRKKNATRNLHKNSEAQNNFIYLIVFPQTPNLFLFCIVCTFFKKVLLHSSEVVHPGSLNFHKFLQVDPQKIDIMK